MANCWFCYKDAGENKYHPKCSKRFFGVEEAPVLTLDDQLLDELARKTVNRRIAVTGVQPKLSVTLEKTQQNSRLTIVGLWGEYILKPQHHKYIQMPEVEDLTMHIASLFKIKVCEHTLLRATDQSLVYLAKRFDRAKGRKVHMEDLCQLSEFPTENKYKGSYEKAGKTIIQYCTNKGLDALNYFDLVLFSYLSGNNDMHLKNFSVLHTALGIVLSPAYDLLNVNLVNPEDDEELGLHLNGEKKKIKLRDFEKLADALNIHSKVRNNSFDRLQSKNEEVINLINSSFLIEDNKEKYQAIWTRKQSIFN